jgi:transposase
MKVTFNKRTVKRLEKTIETALRLNNFRLFKIAKSLLMIAEEIKTNRIAKFFKVSEKTVYDWFLRFLHERFSWLVGMHYKGRGAKSKLSNDQKGKLYEIVSGGPEKYGFDCGVWNSPTIAEVVWREFQVRYNPRYLCRLLKKIGLSFQKAAFEADRTEDNEKKRKEWLKKTWPEILGKAKETNAAILFGDEVSFAQWGSLSRTWAPVGNQPKIKTKGRRKGLKMFGAIEFFKGTFQFMETDGKFNGESYVLFLKQILSYYASQIILVEDGAPYHGSKVVKDFIENDSRNRLTVYRLPSYSPDFNPIEKLWKNTKRDATHCKFFPTFEDLRNSVVAAFEKYLNDAAKVICVMKQLRSRAGIAY